MNLLAQIGFQKTDKVQSALDAGAIDGYIMSPQYDKPEAANSFFENMAAAYPSSQRLFDPMLYVLVVARHENLKCGKMQEYDYCPAPWPRRGELQAEDRIEDLVQQALAYQDTLEVTSLIAPNILVRNSVDSLWGGIARDFIRITGEVAWQRDDNKPILATLALDSNALAQRQEIDDLLNELTGSDLHVSGFYLLVSFPEGELKNTLTPDVLANWLYLVHSLSENDFNVVVGYADFLSTFLAIAGAQAGATGWHETGRKFSISRFTPQRTGGQPPLPRYSSPTLLNRILLSELRAELEPDLISHPDMLADIRRARSADVQALQHWHAIRNTLRWFATGDTEARVENARRGLQRALRTYERLNSLVELDPKSDGREFVSTVIEGLGLFSRLLRGEI